MNKKIIFVALAVVISISAYVGIKLKKHTLKLSQVFAIEKPVIKDLTQYVSSTGNLRAKDFISVGSLEAGKVVKILVDDNDVVKKGQVLVELDNGIGDSAVKKLKAQVAENQSALRYQTAYFARQKALFESGQLSKNLFDKYLADYDIVKSRLEQYKASLEMEEKKYDNLFIKSPENGMVIAKRVDLGQMVTAQLQATVLFEIAQDLHKMEARIDVDESDIGLVKEGQAAVFVVDAFPKDKFTAKVKQVEYEAKIVDNVVTYATILEVNNPDLRLRPGMTTNVDIRVADASNAICVPNKALRVNRLSLEQAALKLGYTVVPLNGVSIEKTVGKKISIEQETLWVLEGTSLKQVAIELGNTDGKFTQISSGINKTSQVVTEVLDITRENLILKGMFGKTGGIGK